MKSLIFCFTTLFLIPFRVYADDGAASIAAGGIVMEREPRITMQKEVLRISVEKVSVDYEFRNDTDKSITTEIAFPVPPYSLDWDTYSINSQGFDDFHLTVQQKPTHFDVETKAMLKGRDQKLNCVVALIVDKNLLIERAVLRRTDKRTGQIYHLKYNPPPPDADLEHRADDQEDKVRNRIDVYERMTADLLPFYEKAGLLERVDGVGEVSDVTQRVLAALDRRK